MRYVIPLIAFIAVMIAFKFWVAPIIASFGVAGLAVWIAVCLTAGLRIENSSDR